MPHEQAVYDPIFIDIIKDLNGTLDGKDLRNGKALRGWGHTTT